MRINLNCLDFKEKKYTHNFNRSINLIIVVE